MNLSPIKVSRPKSFHSIFLEKRIASEYFTKITNCLTGKTILENFSIDDLDNHIHIIYDVSSYLNLDVNAKEKGWKVNKLKTYKGSMIVLKKYQDLDDYLKRTLSSGRRSKLRTYQKKLYYSFDIKYKIYHGDISYEEYKLLFDKFYQMIENRFNEKQTIHKDLKRWDAYFEMAYSLILKKEACLFVLYHDDKPISISLNLIHDKLIYGYVRGYDIDYSKFYIGLIDIVKQLEWCFENKFEVFDLLKGDYGYKKQWADEEYDFEKYIIYNARDLKSNVIANIVTLKSKLFYIIFNLLKKLNIHLLYRKYKNYKNSKTKLLPNKKVTQSTNYIEIITLKDNIEYPKININDDNYSFMRKAFYTFLYTNNENINDIEIFEVEKEHIYIFKGTKYSHKMTFKSFT